MSAPPIAAVVVYPLIKLKRVLVERNAAAINGVDGAADKKAACNNGQKFVAS